jgi:23S rRNA pseudouridine1911/1915/1917 synthase
LSSAVRPSPSPSQDPAAWLPAALNRGHIYRDRPNAPAASISAFYAGRYGHSDRAEWERRLAAGEIRLNGRQLRADGPLAPGDRLAWHRPPWQELAVPVLPETAVVFDDGDLLVLNKPSGLPVLPAGGFLLHTLLAQLEGWVAAGRLDAAAGLPRPVHRLGRFTSGLLVCARRPASRAWLSALLRESTTPAAPPEPSSGHPTPLPAPARGCLKLYRALLCPPQPGSPLLALAELGTPRSGVDLPASAAVAPDLWIDAPIGRRPHARLGALWAAAEPGDAAALPALSAVRLIAQRPEGWLVAVTIASGRPHQIRIHAAVAGAPLLGDPLYGPGGLPLGEALPGDGGYRLHAHRLELPLPEGRRLALEAPLPAALAD